MSKKMTDDEFLGLSCYLGPMAAIALREFESTFTKKLPQLARNYLIRAFVALETIPKDGAREKALLRDALCKLRDEWQERRDA